MKYFVVLLFAFKTTCAQNTIVDEAVELYLEYYEKDAENEGHDHSDEMLRLEEVFQHYLEQPISINNCTYDELLKFPLFNEHQVTHLLSYKRRYGDFRSLVEFRLLPQFPPRLCAVISPFINISKGERKIKRRTKSSLLGTQRFSWLGDTSDRGFIGSGEYQAYKLRVKDFKPGYSLALNIEKDRGEMWYHPRTGIEHANFNLSYKQDNSVVKTTLLGTYKLSFGQGLVANTGFNNYRNSFVHQGRSFSKQKIRPQNGNNEFAFLRGGAVEIKVYDFTLSSFASYNKADATVYEDSTGVFFSSIGNSGMHRNALELSKKDRVEVVDFGTSLEYAKDQYNFSWNHMYTNLSEPMRRSVNYYNSEYLTGSDFYVQSIDFNVLYKHAHVFGEFAADKQLDFAALFGVSGSINPLLNWRTLFRNYSNSYQSFRGQTYQQSGQLRNERGVVFQVDSRLGEGFDFHAFADYYVFPSMSYRKRFSAGGKEHAVKLSYAREKKLQVYIKYKFKEGELNYAKGIYFGQTIASRREFRINCNYVVDKFFSCRGQGVYALFKGADGLSSGLLFFQECRYVNASLSLTPRVSFFSIDDYSARIYVHESGLGHSSPFLFFTGKGIRFSLKMTYNFNKHFNFGIKYYKVQKRLSNPMVLQTSAAGVNVQCRIRF